MSAKGLEYVSDPLPDCSESSIDVPYGEEQYDCVLEHQAKLIEVLTAISNRYGFSTVDPTLPGREIFRRIQLRIEGLLAH